MSSATLFHTSAPAIASICHPFPAAPARLDEFTRKEGEENDDKGHAVGEENHGRAIVEGLSDEVVEEGRLEAARGAI